MSVAVDLKGDSKREFGSKKISLAFRPNTQFRKSPVSGGFDGKEIVPTRDGKYSFAIRLIMACERIEQFWIEPDLGVFRVRRFCQQEIGTQQMPRDVGDVSHLIRKHNDPARFFGSHAMALA